MGMRLACDVFNTAEEVKKYKAWIQATEGDEEIIEFEGDLCEKAFERLIGLMARGFAPPKKPGQKTRARR